MNTIPVLLAERSYEIAVGHGIIAQLGDAMSKLGLGLKQMIVTSEALWPLYGKPVRESLESSGFQVSVTTLGDDEEAKSLHSLTTVFDSILENGLDRQSGIVAVGGGVIGDIAGFAAATYMRGIRYVQVPTTLLAQVDSSIGGKTGVNHPKAKNLIGAFHQPALVWTDVSTLETLPEREVRSGIAEVIKYGVIADPELLEAIGSVAGGFSQAPHASVIEIISRCCSIKARIVQEDEEDQGVRAILNYGHTVGHALETMTGYARYTHGEAIAIGMMAAAQISHEIGAADEHMVSAQKHAVDMARLPGSIDQQLDPEGILRQLDKDKKRLSGRVRWVLPRKIGEVFVTDQVQSDTVLKVLKDLIPA